MLRNREFKGSNLNDSRLPQVSSLSSSIPPDKLGKITLKIQSDRIFPHRFQFITPPLEAT
jgi:hypothetical protein